MSRSTGPFVSRADIARLTEVRPPAVSNWARRHPDFPRPVEKGVQGVMFRADEIAAWLDKRAIPADARAPGEPAGITYADRFRANLGSGLPESAAAESAAMTKRVRELMGPMAGRLGDRMPAGDYLEFLLELIYLRWCGGRTWRLLADSARSGADDADISAVLWPVLDSPDGGNEVWRRYASVFARAGDARDLAPIIGLLDVSVPDRQAGSGNGAAALFGLLIQRWTEIEGRKAGEIITPATVVRLMTELLLPADQAFRVYDPFCRSGEFLAAAIERFSGDPTELLVVGRHPSERIRRIAAMNVSLHDVDPDVVSEWSLERPAHPSRRFDYVLTNPPFNLQFAVDEGPGDSHWPYGPPPEKNANYAWLQHAVASLVPGGQAGVIMANNASFSANRREHDIRRKMVEGGAVECLMALPPGLFPSTAVPVTLWLLRHPTGHCDEVFFVDARDCGTMLTRTQRVLTDEDVAAIVSAWSSRTAGEAHYRLQGEDRSLRSRAVPISEIRARDYALSPPIYATTRAERVDARAAQIKLSQLTAELDQLESRRAAVDVRIDRMLKGMERWNR